MQDRAGGGKFRVGQKIWLEHTREEAVITRIDKSGVLYVNAGGHVIPVFMSQVSKRLPEKPVVANGKNNPEDTTPGEPKHPTVAIDKTKITRSRVALVFIPQRLSDGEIVRYETGLVNETPSGAFAYVTLRLQNGEEKCIEKRLGEHAYLKLETFTAEAFNELSAVVVRLEPDDRMLDVFEAEQKIKASAFVKRNALVESIGSEAFIYEMLEQFAAAPKQVDVFAEFDAAASAFNKKKSNRVVTAVPIAKPTDEEPTEIANKLQQLRTMMLDKPSSKETVPIRQVKDVDLHIEAILPSHEGMLPMDILLTQIEHFTKALDHAIVSGQKVFYVVHGLGTGKLRREIEKILDQHDQVASFNNSYHPRYGHGATEVHLK